MRRLRLVIVAATMLVATSPTPAINMQRSGRQMLFKLVIWQGDPLGSREAGTLKILAEPRLVTSEDRPFTFAQGGEQAVPDGASRIRFVDTGRSFSGKWLYTKDGNVQLDITLADTAVVPQTGERVQFHTESVRTIMTVKLGELVKLRRGKGTPDKQVWAELSAHQVKP
jgi:hypothetical protein